MRRTIGGLRKSGNYGKAKEKIYSSPFEAEWAVLNQTRIKRCERQGVEFIAKKSADSAWHMVVIALIANHPADWWRFELLITGNNKDQSISPASAGNN
ncbi:TPA: hypothetical protein ACOEGC_002620 [Enterobacter kobei]